MGRWFQQFVHADYGEVLDLAALPCPECPLAPSARTHRIPENEATWRSSGGLRPTGVTLQGVQGIVSLMDLGPGSRDSSVGLHRAITIGRSGPPKPSRRGHRLHEGGGTAQGPAVHPGFSVPSQSYMSTNLVGILCATVDIPLDEPGDGGGVRRLEVVLAACSTTMAPGALSGWRRHRRATLQVQ